MKLIECCCPLDTTESLFGLTAGAGTVVAVEVPKFPVDISLILGNLITVIFDYQIPHKPLKILSL